MKNPAHVEAMRAAKEFASKSFDNHPQFIVEALNTAQTLQETAARAFDEYEAQFKINGVNHALRDFYYFSTAYELVDEARKGFGKKTDHLKNSVLPEMMETAKVKTVNMSFGRDGDRRFTVNVRQSCSMEDKAGGIQWLKEQGHGGIVQETVNASTLSAFSKRYVEDSGRDLPAEFFKIGTMKYVSVTKT